MSRIPESTVSINDGDVDMERSRLLGSGEKRNYSNGAINDSQEASDGQDVELEVEIQANNNQSSLVTIFSMWNTMMGTSLLSIPWAIKQAGFVNGIVLLVAMAGLMTYASYRVLVSGRFIFGRVITDFSDSVKFYLGRTAEVFTLVCSLFTLLGAAIVYWILMSNFLYHIVVFLYSKTHSEPSGGSNTSSLSEYTSANLWTPTDDSIQPSDVLCHASSNESEYRDPTFKKVWNETNTVPFFLLLIVYPLMNFKSPTFFTKFNALGTLSVTYLSVFVVVKAAKWGIHFDMNTDHKDAIDYVPNFEWSFPALTGIAALAFFLQNCVMTIVRNQRHPENNTRDLIIAYSLVCLTYASMGCLFYVAFPFNKTDCIEDNFLNNFKSTDVMAFVARIGLFFQMMCVLPLIAYIFRAQLLHFLFKSVWPSFKHVLLLNVLFAGVCILFAVFVPKIGHIIGFVGAFCGFSYGIALPCLVYLVSCYRMGTLTKPKVAFHGLLILIGLINFLAQFVIIGHTH